MEQKEDFGIKDKIHIVLTGPDGKVKQEIKQELVLVAEDGTLVKNNLRGEKNATDKRPEVVQQDGNQGAMPS